MTKRCVVVAAHPDDEVLGCGGTVARHAEAGDEVHTYILAEGLTSRDQVRDRTRHREGLNELAAAARRANELLGVSSVTLRDFPDNRMDGVEILDVVKVVEEIGNTHRPQVVYTHHFADVNIDHTVVHNAVVTACRSLPQSPVEELLFFEIPSSSEWRPAHAATAFLPQLYVDVSATLTKKLAALEAYAGEMRPWPHARSLKAVEHLARWRGATVACDAAEAFMVGRIIRGRVNSA